jgi:hypothetical protein
MAEKFIYWNDLRGLPINLEDKSYKLGIIENFYYQNETHSIKALRVHTNLHGYRVLLSSAIKTLEPEDINVANENMLIDETNSGSTHQLPKGDGLIGFRVFTESGRLLGTISDLLLGIYPPVALRISAIELDGKRTKQLSASEITHFDEGVLEVTDQAGKRMH